MSNVVKPLPCPFCCQRHTYEEAMVGHAEAVTKVVLKLSSAPPL